MNTKLKLKEQELSELDYSNIVGGGASEVCNATTYRIQ